MKRSNGEGSIRKRPDGRWQARYTVRDGGALRRRDCYGKTKAEVSRQLREALAARDGGAPKPIGRETTASYLGNWLEAVRPTMRPRSWERAEDQVRLHLAPRLGRVPLVKLTPAEIQRCYADLLATGLSAATVRRAHAVLRSALQQALRWRLIAANPADLVIAPKAQRREMQTLSPEQARCFLEAVKGDTREALYVLAITSGLRLGELLALRWPEVDLDAGMLRVTGTLGRVRGRGLAIGEPKTGHSRRRVQLSQTAVASLSGHRSAQLEHRIAAANLWQDRQLVFCGWTGGYLHASEVLQRLHKLLEHIGLPRLRFHDLRHTAATLMLGRGVHPKIVSEMLGHSTIAITLDLYSHVTKPMQQEAARAMDGLFSTAADA